MSHKDLNIKFEESSRKTHPLKWALHDYMNEALKTNGSFVNFYFSKRRKRWVVYYSQSKKVEDVDLIRSLKGATQKIIEKRKKQANGADN